MKAIVTFLTIAGITPDPITIKGENLDVTIINNGACEVYDRPVGGRVGKGTFNNVLHVQLKGKPKPAKQEPTQIEQATITNLLQRGVEHLARISDTLYLANEPDVITTIDPVAMEPLTDADFDAAFAVKPNLAATLNEVIFGETKEMLEKANERIAELESNQLLYQERVNKIIRREANLAGANHYPDDHGRGMLNGLRIALDFLDCSSGPYIQKGESVHGQPPAQWPVAPAPQPDLPPVEVPEEPAYDEPPVKEPIGTKRRKEHGQIGETPEATIHTPDSKSED